MVKGEFQRGHTNLDASELKELLIMTQSQEVDLIELQPIKIFKILWSEMKSDNG